MTDETSHPIRRALVVEDSEVSRKLLTFILENAGFEVVVAANGKEGVDKFATQSFDVVIMDIQMPVMDGLEATRLIREHEKQSGTRTPVIAVTAGMDRGSCMKADMDEYVEKPVQVSVFHEALQRACCGLLILLNAIHP